MTGVVLVIPKHQFFDALGNPLAGGTVTVYEAGTTSIADSWQDRGLATLNTNPVTLDSAGRCDLFGDPSHTYKLVVKDALGITQYTVDNVPGAGSQADFQATINAAVASATAAAQAAQAAAETARDQANAATKIYASTAAGLAGVASGQYFYVPSASSSDESLILYLNNAGVAVEQKRMTSADGIRAAKARMMETRVKGACKNGGGTLKALFHADSKRTYATAPDTLSEWISADDTPITASLFGTLFSGADPRPKVDATRGMYFNSQAGLSVASGILTKTTNFAQFFVFDVDIAPTSYATKVAADAAAGAKVEGDRAKVTADTNTTFSPDVTLVYDAGFTDSQLVNGYYNLSVGAWGAPSGALWSLMGTGGAFMKGFFNRLGQYCVQLYSGSGAIADVRTRGTDYFAKAGRHMGALFCKNGFLEMHIDGQMVHRIKTTQNATTFNTLYFNGTSRTANPAIPVNGLRHYSYGFAVLDDCTFEAFRAAHDAMADYAGTPRLDIPAELWIILSQGQSWQDGSTDTSTDTWTTASGWNGMITQESTGRSGDPNRLTQDAIARAFTHRDQNNNDDIGPLAITLNGLGNNSAAETHKCATGGGESWEFSALRHLTAYANLPHVDWGICAAGAGGALLSLLTAETPFLVQVLKSKTSADLTYLEEMYQSVVYMRDFALSRGQRPVVKLWHMQEGHSDLGNASFDTDMTTHYDKVNTAMKRITGQSEDVQLLMPQINWSSNGVRNSCNSLSGVVDQKILDMVTNRGTRPMYCLGPMYQITNFIHPYRAGHRWIGEMFGKHAKRLLGDGNEKMAVKPATLTRGTNTVDIVFDVPVGSLQFATNANNIASTIQIDGVNTYGFEVYKGTPTTVTVSIASPGVVTWNAHGKSNGDRIRIGTTGALPTGLDSVTDYYIVNAAANTFQLSLTAGGAAINTSGTQSGTHTAYDVSKRITAVATTAADTVRITCSANLAAGDIVAYAGIYSRYGNLCDQDAETAFYKDQDWTVPIVGGKPTYKAGNLYDLKNWGCAFKRTLA